MAEVLRVDDVMRELIATGRGRYPLRCGRHRACERCCVWPAAGGVSVPLVEQKLTIELECCYSMGHGRVVFEGTPAELRADAYVRREWLEV